MPDLPTGARAHGDEEEPMPAKRDQQLLIDAARLYYVDGLDQGQVGERMGAARGPLHPLGVDLPRDALDVEDHGASWQDIEGVS